MAMGARLIAIQTYVKLENGGRGALQRGDLSFLVQRGVDTNVLTVKGGRYLTSVEVTVGYVV